MSNSDMALAVAPVPENRGQTCPTCKQPWLHRSDADHRMLHAIVSIAYTNWPESHEFEPMGRDHLYGWLLIQAGHHEPPIDIASRKPEIVRETLQAITPIVAKRFHCIKILPMAKGYRVLFPKSLSYKEAGKRQFEDVRSKVYEVIETVLGTDIETLKREAKAA
jgi:hypothetical protein